MNLHPAAPFAVATLLALLALVTLVLKTFLEWQEPERICTRFRRSSASPLSIELKNISKHFGGV